MKTKLLSSFISLVFLVNICFAFKFYSNDADVTISGTTYYGCDFYADSVQNGQQIVYPFPSYSITETELYNNSARYQICSSSSCNAYYVSYHLPNYALTGLSPTSTNVNVNGINTNYYSYNDGSFLVQLWAVPGSSPVQIVQVSQTGNGLDRQIFFHSGSISFTTTVTLAPPSSTQYPGCAATVQCGSALDIVLVIDTSGSITADNYVIEQNYDIEVVDQFDVGIAGVHIGFITFSTSANIHLNLTYDKQLITSTILGVKQDKGETDIGGAIYAAISVFQYSGRSGIPSVIIFLTDGNANEPNNATYGVEYMNAAANAAHAAGIITYAVGVGNDAYFSQLLLISSGPSYVNTVANFTQLQTTLAPILETVCVGGDTNACAATCTNTQFCGCGSCVCADTSPICGSRGSFDSSSCSCKCSGNWQNSATVSDCSVCNLSCENGGIVNYSTCECECNDYTVNGLTPQWVGNTCESCLIQCNSNGQLIPCLGCQCFNFWTGVNCTVCTNKCSNGGTVTNTDTCSGCTCPANSYYTSSSDCSYCNAPCENGQPANSGCTGCDCTGSNFVGQFCQTCSLSCGTGSPNSDCSACNCPGNTFLNPDNGCVGCVSGYCKNGGSPTNSSCLGCNCVAPWTGKDCTTCNLNCHNGTVQNPGTCNSCSCNYLYDASTDCSTCNENYCGAHGSPNSDCSQCVCSTGWAGALCDVCASDLCYGNGQPDANCQSCACNQFASGTFCETCNSGDCLNGAVVSSDCNSCECVHGWSGNTCNTCSKTNYAVINGPCLNNSLSEECFSLVVIPGGTTIGKVCYALDSWGNLFVTAFLSSDTYTLSSLSASILTSTPTYPASYSNYQFTTYNGYVLETIQVSIGTTYYGIVKATLSAPSQATAYSSITGSQASYNYLTVGSCSDCLCDYTCYYGSIDSECSVCTCFDQWTGSTCSICDSTDTSFCNGNGHLYQNTTVTPATCNSCICDGYWTGITCDTCNFPCQNGGTPDASNGCTSCDCPEGSGWDGASCQTCDPALLCYGRGTVNTTCSNCTCNAPWIGERCTDCSLTCNGRGVGNSDCTSCVCDSPWTGADCSICSSELLCNSVGVAVNTTTCDSCVCPYPWAGTTCEICAFNCYSNGVPNAQCSGCDCNGAYIIYSNCSLCDQSNECIFCNGRGNISNPDTTCNDCTCQEYWGGTTCDTCLLTCSNGGAANSACAKCDCLNQFTAASNCSVCALDEICTNNGYPDPTCSYCNCVNGWGGSDCTVCQTVQSDCQNSGVLNTETCSCECPDEWDGRLCDTCPTTNTTACNAPDGGFIVTLVANVEVCQCACVGNWGGPTCGSCKLNPLFGNATCADIQIPRLSDCTCHCPEYYVDTEACDQCIITPADCVYPVELDYVNLTDCSCGPCVGNYVGRNCSICNITTSDCPYGYAFNSTNCSCYVLCGNNIITPPEQCEVGLMAADNQVCCSHCMFNNTATCDDGNTCTFDDICTNGTCQGLSSITFNVDTNRTPLSAGIIPTNAFTAWGLSVYGIDATPILYDTTTTARSNLNFPNSNPFGGAESFGLVLAQTPTNVQSVICLEFSSPFVFSLISLLGVNQSGTQVKFYCADPESSEYTQGALLLTSPGGPGGVQYIPVPCGSYGVNSICVTDLYSGAIGPLYTCDTSHLPLAEIGELVWNDFNMDNIHQSNEPGVPGAIVTLYDENLNYITQQSTNDEGLYLFTNLYAGNYIVEFDVCCNNYRFSTPLSLVNGVLWDGRTVTFFLAENQIDLSRNAGVFILGEIGQFVWYDINENGIYDSGETGVGGVQMNLYFTNDTTTLLSSTVTNSTGYYLFPNLLVIQDVGVYYNYSLIVFPPPNSIVTKPFQGPSTVIDSHFDQVTHYSNIVTLSTTITGRNDLTIDCGIYYCCGSIGEYVWFDLNDNGLQDVGEPGVPNSPVDLFWNGVSYNSTTTNSTGYYLFTGLPLAYYYNVHFNLPNSSYVFTTEAVGPNPALYSSANPSGVSNNIVLTITNPNNLTIDAGIITGCQSSFDCVDSSDQCKSAACINNQCEYTPKVLCAPSTNACYYSQCDPVTGQCVHISTGALCNDGNNCTSNDVCTVNGCVGTPNTNPCSDGLFCTTNDVCSDGFCSGTPIQCGQSLNPCQDLVCSESQKKCIAQNNNNNTCSDNNYCTSQDYCLNGACVSGTPVVCPLSDACHTIQCSPSTGQCVTTINIGNTCNDQSSCTNNDLCQSDGSCSGTPIVCSQVGLNQCQESICQEGSGCVTIFVQQSCNDNNNCTVNDVCDSTSQTCKGTPMVCPTAPCLTYTCQNGVCNPVANNSLTCTDLNSCTNDACISGVCVSTPINCNDNNPCTSDNCIAGVCVHTNNFNPCNDSDPCTVQDTCSAGVCKGTPMNCNDNNPCTADSCVANNGVAQCVGAPVPGTPSCDDYNLCTLTSYCVSGVCQGYNETVCNDNNPCTKNSCNPLTGTCVTTYNTLNCTTGNACSPTGVCTSGVCVGIPVNCQASDNVCLESICANGVCQYQPNLSATTCNDSNPCTLNDHCSSGSCVGTQVVCTPQDSCHFASCSLTNGSCVQSPLSGVSCNDNNPCTLNDTCNSGICAGTLLVCEDNNPCTTDVCSAGTCVTSYNTASCNDANPCTLNDTCNSGICAGTAVVCEDFNVCTTDTCDILTGKCQIVNNNNTCNDQNLCTTNDVCVLGTCTGTPVTCTGTNTCLNYFCNPQTGSCDTSFNTNPCNDGNLCTSIASCVNGTCVGQPIICGSNTACELNECAPSTGKCIVIALNSGNCSDNNPCTVNDTCNNGVCTGTFSAQCLESCSSDSQCVSQDLCHKAHCNLTTSLCYNVPVTCTPTNNVCTQNTCSLTTGTCTISNVNGPCNDNNACTLTDICSSGQCIGLNTVNCTTSAQCETSACSPATGLCVLSAITDGVTPCTDSSSCTTNDVCTSNGCVGTPINCNDANPCTTDSCTNGKCVYVNNTNTCSDNNNCTLNDYCSLGVCVSGALLNCDDGNVCTSDSCQNGICIHTLISGGNCNDNNLCTSNDVCSNGVCAGTPINCNDSNPCTTDGCYPNNGTCYFTPSFNGLNCTDGSPCTVNDVCTNGVCTGTSNCPPANVIPNQCTTYTCNSKGGCTAVYSNSSCTSTAFCYQTNGTCSNGQCVSAPISCDDNNACTVDSCSTTTGQCVHTNHNVTCTPTVPDACHTYACVNSACTAIAPINCDDGNNCTKDSCVNGACVYTIQVGIACNDGNSCTLSDYCTSSGICVGTVKNCSDSNVCTTDYCDTTTGSCVNAANTLTCNPNNLCASSGQCSNSVCNPVNVKNCAQTACNKATCNPATGNCTSVPDNTQSCTDNNLCTTDTCSAGVCVSTPLTCTAPAGTNNPCVTYSCNPATGNCTSVNYNNGVCTDNNACTTDTCNNGACSSVPIACPDDGNACTYSGPCNTTTGACSNIPYSCVLSPCLYYGCTGLGTCELTGSISTYNPLVYLSIQTGSGSGIGSHTFSIVALNISQLTTSVFYTLSDFSAPLNSIDVDPYSGYLYAIAATTTPTLIAVVPDQTSKKLTNGNITLTSGVNSALEISARALYVSTTSPYTYYLYGLLASTDAFTIYNENGALLNAAYSAPTHARLLSWDILGATAYFFITGSSQLYLWDGAYSAPVCTNVNFGPGTIVGLDTGADGTVYVGTTSPVALFAVTVTSGACTSYQFTLPSNVTSATLLSLTADNTYCPLAAPPATTTTTTGTPPSTTTTTGVPPATTTTGHSPVAPVGSGLSNAAAASGPTTPVGQDTNLPLTGVSGYISTAVVGSIAGVAVIAAAIFGAVIGLNTSKEEKAVPLDTLLTPVDVNSVATNNAIFQAAPPPQSSALYG